MNGIHQAAANAARVLAFFRKKMLPVFHVRHEFETDEGPFFLPGSQGAQINESVRPLDGEPVVLKHYPNAFRGTVLKDLLDRQAIRELTIIGAMRHVCIDATARAAADFDYKVTVVQDAVATRDLVFGDVEIPSDQVHAAYMAALAFAYGRIVSTVDVVDEAK